MGLQLDFVENENLTEINIMMSGFDYSFASLITVILLYNFDLISSIKTMTMTMTA